MAKAIYNLSSEQAYFERDRGTISNYCRVGTKGLPS